MNKYNLYAEEFLLFLDKHNVTFDGIEAEILNIKNSFENNALLDEYILRSPIDDQKKLDLLKEYCKDKYLFAFINTLVINKDLGKILIIFDDIISMYYLKKKNRMRVFVTSVVELTDGQKNKISQLVKKHTGCDSEIIGILNESIWGGCIIKFQDYVIDLSIRSNIEKIAKKVIG